jgi:sigma-B regulation protein RsbU (phosphoserine phosphatase)
VIAARYIPMTSVAGDFYDFLPVDDKRFGAPTRRRCSTA